MDTFFAIHYMSFINQSDERIAYIAESNQQATSNTLKQKSLVSAPYQAVDCLIFLLYGMKHHQPGLHKCERKKYSHHTFSSTHR